MFRSSSDIVINFDIVFRYRTEKYKNTVITLTPTNSDFPAYGCFERFLIVLTVMTLQTTVYNEIMRMFVQVSIESSSPYSSAEKDEKIRGYR